MELGEAIDKGIALSKSEFLELLESGESIGGLVTVDLRNENDPFSEMKDLRDESSERGFLSTVYDGTNPGIYDFKLNRGQI